MSTISERHMFSMAAFIMDLSRPQCTSLARRYEGGTRHYSFHFLKPILPFSALLDIYSMVSRTTYKIAIAPAMQ